jgi:hypothetical protein
MLVGSARVGLGVFFFIFFFISPEEMKMKKKRKRKRKRKRKTRGGYRPLRWIWAALAGSSAMPAGSLTGPV